MLPMSLRGRDRGHRDRLFWKLCATRRGAGVGKAKLEPVPPPGRPYAGAVVRRRSFAALGAFMLFLGLVFGGPLLVIGAIALALTLLYWLARGAADLRPRSRRDGAAAAGRRPRWPAAGRPHAGPVVPARSSRRSACDAVARPRLRGVAARGRRHRADPDARRLADGRAQGVRQDRRGRLDRPSREHPRPADAQACCYRVLAIAARRRVRDPGRLAPAARRQGGDGVGVAGSVRRRRSGRARSGEPGASPGGRPLVADGLTRRTSQFVETTFAGAGRTAVQARVRQRGRGDPHNVEIKDGAGDVSLQGRGLPRRRRRRSTTCRPSPPATYPFLCTVHPTMTGTATAPVARAHARSLTRRVDRSSSPLAIAVVTAVGVWWFVHGRSTDGRATVGQPAPPIVGTTLDGTPFDLAALRGRPVVVNFWGPSCIPCRDEFPQFLRELRGRTAGRSGDRRRPDRRPA